jgi:hypothetical protein
MNAPVQALPDFEKLYAAVTRSTALDAVYEREGSKIKQLACGLQLFSRPDAETAAKLKRNEAVPLVGAASGYKGTPGKAASSWQPISKLLVLHEAQAVLLLRRWIRDNVPKSTAAWTPKPADTHSICQTFFTQRWHLLLTLKFIIEVSLDALHSSHRAACAILAELGPKTVLTSLLATATGTLKAVSGAFTARSSRASPDPDGALILHDEQGIINWKDQASCELCCMQLIILSLLQTTQPDEVAIKPCTQALLDHALRPGTRVLEDTSTMAGLAVRLGITMLLACLGCECGPFQPRPHFHLVCAIVYSHF